jgi:predicted acylesterase/phospholipase RssA/CRP-like cAMP-binding protein
VSGRAEGASRQDQRIVATLERYFGISLAAGHPLLEEVETRRIPGGEWLMRQGDPGESLYFLAHGRLQAWAAEGDNPRGRFLNEIVPGDSVGELSLLTGAPRSVGIQAIRDSLLIRVDREAFEKLTQTYPALALRLAANVAGLLQSSRRSRPSTRNLKTIGVLPLDATPRSEDFCRRFAEQLARQGRTLTLAADRLGALGAPVEAVADGHPVPPGLSQWLDDIEDEFRFVVYQCAPANPTWARFALRQSDMVLFVGEAAADPALRPWETRLDDSADAAIARRMLILLQSAPGRPIRDTAAWLAQRRIDFHVHVREGVASDIGRIVRIVSGRALGLVLAGGAARGFAHLGVYRAMQELDLPVDWIGGTSLGAIMAAALASPHGLDGSLAIAREAFVKGKPFSDFTLPLVSLISGRRMDRLLRTHLDLMIEDLPTPFYCVSCYLDTGTMKVHERGYLPEALRASAAIPGIIPPAVVDGRLAVDGAVINNLPVDIMQLKPVGTIVAVDLSAAHVVPVDYPKIPTAWAILRGRYLPFAHTYRVPGLSTVLLKATELGTLEKVREFGAAADLLLHPPVRQFGMTEVKSFDRIVQAGYRHARQELEAWLERRRQAGCPP